MVNPTDYHLFGVLILRQFDHCYNLTSVKFLYKAFQSMEAYK